jgi:hypothetical protein
MTWIMTAERGTLTTADVQQSIPSSDVTVRNFCDWFKPVQWMNIQILELSETAAREIAHTLSSVTYSSEGGEGRMIALLPKL